MLIDGEKVSIRDNLWLALQRSRHPTKPRTLWVDSLSICQTDADEKAQQVLLIGNIFRQALRVLVWIGEYERRSEELFSNHYAVEPSRARKNHPWYNIDRPGKQPGQVRQEIWQAFLDRPYWTRRWIIQEIILAKDITVHCGNSTMAWSELIEARHVDVREGNYIVEYLDGIAFLKARSYPNFFQLVKMRKAKVQNVPLTSLMATFRQARCTDDRDRVYALLALDSGELVIQPSYKITLEQLFVMVLDSRLRRDQRLIGGSSRPLFPISDQLTKVKETWADFDLTRAQRDAITQTMKDWSFSRARREGGLD